MIFGKPREKRAEEEVTFGLCFVSSIIKLSTIVIIQVCLPKKNKKRRMEQRNQFEPNLFLFIRGKGLRFLENLERD